MKSSNTESILIENKEIYGNYDNEKIPTPPMLPDLRAPIKGKYYIPIRKTLENGESYTERKFIDCEEGELINQMQVKNETI